MRKETGFTLIELLAVIVILGIIALISTPLIINVIDEAKKGAFKNTAYGIIKAGEIGYVQDILSGTAEEVTFTYTDGVESSTPSGKTLNYKGTRPQNGTVKINSQGKVALAIHDGSVCAEKGFDTSEVSISSKTVGECVIVDINAWPDNNGYIYEEGTHEDKWVEGYSDGENIVYTKDATTLSIDIQSDIENFGTWVTDDMIDLSNYSTLYIEWESIGFTKQIVSKDISAINDSAYIRVHYTYRRMSPTSWQQHVYYFVTTDKMGFIDGVLTGFDEYANTTVDAGWMKVHRIWFE